MLNIIGDSHATCSFGGIPDIKIHYTGATTLKRVGVLEDDYISNMVKSMNLNSNDALIFVFGEIDIRCYVKSHLEHHQNSTLEGLLQNWVDKYAAHISLMQTNGAKIGLMSVVPPATFSSAQSVEWPVSGSDEERVLYTKKINEILKTTCENRGWLYLDVYSKYVDENGMLPLNKIFMSVHIKDTTEVKNLLHVHQLL